MKTPLLQVYFHSETGKPFDANYRAMQQSNIDGVTQL